MFRVVEMSVTTVNWEVGMGQSASGSIERISIAVFSTLESDLDVNLRKRFYVMPIFEV